VEFITEVRQRVRWLAGEVAVVVGPATGAVRRRQWSRLWMGPAAAMIVACLSLAFRTRPGHIFIETYAITRPGEPLHMALLRLPLSMFAPAALLPIWFAVLQVGVVYALAQALLGVRTTILVAAAGHTLATLSAHAWVLMGPPLGVGHRFDHFGDAGPSVAVVALIAYVAVARRVSWLAVAIVAYHSIELVMFNALSQREHLIGAVTGAVAAAVTRLAQRDLGELDIVKLPKIPGEEVS